MPSDDRRAHRHAGHVLDAGGDHDVVRAGHHTLRREVRGLLRRTALAVDGGADRRLGEAGGERGVAGDVDALLADLHDATHDHVLDRGRDRRRCGRRARAARAAARSTGCDVLQLAVAAPERRTEGVDDDGVGHECLHERMCARRKLDRTVKFGAGPDKGSNPAGRRSASLPNRARPPDHPPRRVGMEPRAALAGLARLPLTARASSRPGTRRRRSPTSGLRARASSTAPTSAGPADRRDHRRRARRAGRSRIPACASAAAATGRAHTPTRSTSSGPAMRHGVAAAASSTPPPSGEDDDTVFARFDAAIAAVVDAGHPDDGRDPRRRAAPGRDPRRRPDAALLSRTSAATGSPSSGGELTDPSPSPTSPPPPKTPPPNSRVPQPPHQMADAGAAIASQLAISWGLRRLSRGGRDARAIRTSSQVPRTLPAWRAPEPEKPESAPSASPSRTATSNFGAGRRESHDATAFYERFEAPTLSGDDAVVAPYEIAEPFVNGDARHMDAIVDGSVALVVTSPPYFAGKQYEEELERDGVPSSYVEYLQLLTDVFAECARKLEPGGRIAVNVANLGRKPYRSLAADVVRILQDDLRLLLRGEVVWQQGRRRGRQLRVGLVPQRRPTRCSATSPNASSSRARAASIGRSAAPIASDAACPSTNTIDADEFMEATLDVWDIEPESARRVAHPAPFPVGLPGPAHRPLHLRERSRARSVHGLGLDARRGRAARPPLRRLRPRSRRTSTSRGCASRRRNARSRRAADRTVSPRRTERRDRRRLPGASDKEGKAAQALAEELLVNTGFEIVAKNTRVTRHRRHDQLHRERRRRRRVVLRRVRRIHAARAADCCAPTRSGRRSGARTCSARRDQRPSARVPHVAPAEARAARATSR